MLIHLPTFALATIGVCDVTVMLFSSGDDEVNSDPSTLSSCSITTSNDTDSSSIFCCAISASNLNFLFA